MSFAQGMAAGAAAARGWIDAYDRGGEKRWREEQRAAWRQERDDKQAERTMLQNAAAPVEMREFSGGEAAAEMMRDTRVGPQQDQPTQPLDFNAPMAYQVGARQFTDQAQAQKFADSQNTPEAQAARAAQGYRSLGRYDKAIALEASDMQRQAAQMQLADQQWKRDLGQAMAGGHEGLAAFGAGTAIGQSAGGEIKVVPSADGKTVTYMVTDKDGNAAPIPGLPQFSNDLNGVAQAAWMLDRTVDSAARMSHFTQQQERERQQGNWQASHDLAKDQFAAGRTDADRNFNLNMAQFNAGRIDSNRNYELNKGAQGRADKLADVQIRIAELSYEKALEENKVPPATKMQVDAINNELKTIGSSIAKAQAEGNWNPKNPGVKALVSRQAVLSRQLRQALAQFSQKAAPKFSGKSEDFVREVLPAAQAVAEQHGVPVEAVIGQWGLETGWGRSVVPGTFNLGNIKSFNGTGVAATDNRTGSRDNYRKYGSVNEFADDFSGLIGGSRYRGAVGAKDPQTYFDGLKKGGYAEDPNYVSKGVAAANEAARVIASMKKADQPAPVNTAAAPASATPAATPSIAVTKVVGGVAAKPAAQDVPLTKTEIAGRALDEARAAFARVRSERAPGLAAGAEARQRYAERLERARQDVAKAEAEYQAALPDDVKTVFQRPMAQQAGSSVAVR